MTGIAHGSGRRGSGTGLRGSERRNPGSGPRPPPPGSRGGARRHKRDTSSSHTDALEHRGNPHASDRWRRPRGSNWFWENRRGRPVCEMSWRCSPILGRVHTNPESFDDECEGEEGEEDDIEFLEAGEDAAEAFQSPEEAIDLIALLVKGTIVLPGMQPVGLGRDHWNHAQIQHQLAGLIAFVSAIH